MSKLIKHLALFLSFFLCVNLYAQNRTITGAITDSSGESLPGVAIYVKENSSIGTITDINGNYSIVVPAEGKNLVFSYVGMETQELPIKSSQLNVVMKDEDSILEELVVIGYGTVRRKDLTGSVASVQGDAIQSIPVANVTEAITGKLAGVQITTTEGSPDAEVKIRVRGGGSITQDNSPLYIVDGFPVNSISDIPSSEIESIDVLKDASSTAIYGSRGANGVIIITTKSGKEGKFTATYNAYVGMKKIAKTLDVLSVPDYLRWQYEYALLKNNNDPESYERHFGIYEDLDLYDNIQGNNWQDLVFGRTGNVFNHSLNLSGGTDKFSYVFNYAHIKDKAIMKGSDYKRDNLSLKVKYKPFSNLTFDYSVRYSDAKINGGGMNEQNEKSTADSRMKHAVIYSPIPIEKIGSADDDEINSGELVPPFIAIQDNERVQKRRTLNFAGAVTWKPIKHLTLKSEIGLDHYNTKDDRFYGTTTYYVKNTPSSENKEKPAIVLARQERNTFRNANTINYDFKGLLGSKSNHSMNVLLGHELYIRKSETLSTTVHGFPTDWTASDAFTHTTQGAAHSIDNYMNPDDKMVSFFGRANYDFKSKYILSATFRADGSSRFGKDNHWGYFPSAAVAWRISSEEFMKSTENWLDDLKLRISYGTAGNNNIPSGQIRPEFVSSTTTWIDGMNNYWSAGKILFNEHLKWETTHTRNIGLDFALFKSRLNGSIEFYLNTTNDLLNLFPIQGSGYDYQYRNMGKTENKGVEIQLNYNIVNKKDFGLDLGFNIGFNKNKIKSLGDLDYYYESSTWTSEISNDFIVQTGGSVGEMFGYRQAGRYELSDFEGFDEDSKKWVLKEGVYDGSGLVSYGSVRPGDMKLVDGKQTKIGDANPLHTGGFTINSRFKGFDLSAVFNWSYGNDVYNANKIEYTSTSKFQFRNMIDIMEGGKRWTNLMPNGTITNDAAELAKLNENTTMWSPHTRTHLFTDWAVEDGSFLRLNTLTLGYTFPVNLTKKFYVSNLRLYATAYNVFCITSYSGFDPEVSTRRKTNLTPGVDYSAYPKSRQFLFGVNVTF